MKYRLLINDTANYFSSLYLLNSMTLEEVKSFVVENKFPSIFYAPKTDEFVEEIFGKLYSPYIKANRSNEDKITDSDYFFEKNKDQLDLESNSFRLFEDENEEYDVRPNELFVRCSSNSSEALILTMDSVIPYKEALALVEKKGEFVEVSLHELYVESSTPDERINTKEVVPKVLKVINEESYFYIILDGYLYIKKSAIERMETLLVNLLVI